MRCNVMAWEGIKGTRSSAKIFQTVPSMSMPAETQLTDISCWEIEEKVAMKMVWE